jgi:hypothetical protein
MTMVFQSITGSEAVCYFPIPEVDLAGGVGGIFRIVGDHDDRLAFCVERFE